MISHRAIQRDVVTEPKPFFDALRARLAAGERLLTFYASPAPDPASLALTAIFGGASDALLRTEIARRGGFHALTREHPQAHVFEREIHERWGLEPRDHPWLKPVRHPRGGRAIADYPFFRIEGKEVHEVGVGPIHAGVIEPGHFRFMCLGERVHHLEIQLGYQHRDVEALLLARPTRALGPLVETVAGDTSVGHAWAYAHALEVLLGREISPQTALGRGIGLELERVAMHLATLSGLCADIGMLQGAATYGRLRTTAINATMLVCGSRFGRGWVRPGKARARLDAEVTATLRQSLELLRTDIAIVNDLFLNSRTVAHRFKGVGALSAAVTRELGFVGLVARSSGIAVDARHEPGALAPYGAAAPAMALEVGGDCFARARLRIHEIDRSLQWLGESLERLDALPEERTAPDGRGAEGLPPGAVAVSVVEGFRGEIVHVLETDADGSLAHYRIQDPSLRNWLALALAVRENDISDFPICDKSFDLSYCGNDL